ncbi:MAG TPA: hypothetical protein DEG96_09975 [Candidatus Atribacteria bacterium]|nr:hypothetical protein [Candidatus Atribacteria bacterium]
MATIIKTWEIIDDELKETGESMLEAEKKEKEHLEKWIKTNSKILGEDILIIGEQVYTKSGPLDFLGIDNSGNTVIVELKRDMLPREVLTQAIDYASAVASWDIDKLSEVCFEYSGQSLEDYISEKFEGIKLEDLVINKAQRILLVGFSIEESLSRMIEWLSSNYDLGVNAIILNYIKTSSGDELLSKTVIIPEEIEKAKSDKKKFKILMSDEPGEYTPEELKDLLLKYLSKNLYSAKRIKDVILPYLLKNKIATREELKKEFVRTKAADDKKQAGYFLSLISNQLGQQKKDYLRQIISYEYPNYPWEKDNFRLKEEYREIVENVLLELKEEDNTKEQNL